MTKKSIKTFFTLIILVFVLVIPYFVFAQAPITALETAVENSGYSTGSNAPDVPTYIGGIVAVFMGFLGIIFIVLLIYGGFNWMRAGGDESKVKLAIDTIRRAIIGLLITAGSYAISQFVIYKLLIS